MKKLMISTTTALVAAIGLGGTALAAHDQVKNDKVDKYTYSLDPVQDPSIPNSQASGSTTITVLPNGDVKVKVTATGLAPNLPHLMHLHDVLGSAPSDCPAGTPGDVVTVADGLPAYGAIQLPLPTQVADAGGSISYNAKFPADTPLATDASTTLGDIAGTAQVVVHGIDFDGNGEYAIVAGDPFASQESSIVPGAPLELTAPVLCGGIDN
ncbi:hypothetical protein [Ilumatobacter sp.]|uniref:hypothetical protein n=1 Tax=Ilumatobacter sp. TaxID=1967498 RepID=UPI003B51994C